MAVLKGRGFSRAVSSIHLSAALAAEGICQGATRLFSILFKPRPQPTTNSPQKDHKKPCQCSLKQLEIMPNRPKPPQPQPQIAGDNLPPII
jgi:hypothetical protein